MDKPHPPEAWKRLGRALELRRMQLSPGYSNRRRFARERGAVVSSKTLERLERGERGTYSDDTVADVEHLYALAPGSFWDSVRTGKLTVAATVDPVGDDLREAILALPGLTDDEKRTVSAVARGLRAERSGALAVVAAEPVAPVPAERPAELRYADPAKDAIAAAVWKENLDEDGKPVYVPGELVGDGGQRGIDVLWGAVEYQWRKRQRRMSERGGERTAAAG